MLMQKNNTMVEPGFWDGIDNGVSGDYCFDNLLSILDFPMESLEGDNLGGGDWDTKFQCLGPIPAEDLPGLPPVSKVDVCIGTSVMLPNSSALDDRTSKLKELPYFVEEISSTSIPLDSSDGKESSVSQAPSPISVLESSSSYSAQNRMCISPELVIPVRSRSKRPRPSTFNPWIVMPPISFTSSKKISIPRRIKEKKKKKLSELSGVMEVKEHSFQQPNPTKKCTHCDITNTPQWREGPMGPKTLCNACGVRYRSGRLFPEYRPAASPTFVPSLHSNSHKKVIEMRNKIIQETAMAEKDPAMSPLPEFVPMTMSSYLLDRM